MKKITFNTIKIAAFFMLLLSASFKVNAQTFTTGSQVGGTSDAHYLVTTKDFNGDGYEDIATNDGNNNMRIILSNGSGGFNAAFTLASGVWTYAADDLDNDGDIDIVATSSSQNNTPGFYIYKNDGSGSFSLQSASPTNITFTNYAVASNSSDIAIFDANGDGRKDIILIPYIYSTNNSFDSRTKHFLFLNTTSGSTISFSQNAIITTNQFCAHIMTADIDNDGDQDLVLDGASGNSTEVFKNNGSGSFTFSGYAMGYSGGQFFYDWNNDGFLDIMTMDDYNGYGLRYKLNDGTGNFAAGVQLLGTSNNSQANGTGFLADMNGDGLVDAVYRGTNLSGSRGYIHIYTNTGCGFNSTPDISSTQLTNDVTINIAKIDANHDGKPDVFVIGGGTNKTMLNNIATATPPTLSAIVTVQDAARCGNGNVTLTATASNSGTIKWWDAASGGNQVTTGNNYNASVSLSITTASYWVDASLNGCTSARVKVIATYNGETTTSTSNATVLASQLPFIWVDGKPFNAAGTYTKTMPGGNSKGCDSIATLILTVQNSLPTITGTSNLCVGSTATFSNGFSGGVWSISGRGTINASGVVTGTSAGATVVTYTVGSTTTSKNITVYAQPAIPTISYASGTTGVIGSGGICKNKTFTLVGKPTSGVWSGTLISINANSGVATTGNTTGAASVTYTYTNANGCSSSRTINTNVANCRGVSSQQLSVDNRQLTIYPNPSHSIINLKIDKLIGAGNIVVTDLYGKQIKQQALSIGVNTIDVSSFAKGIYFVSVITENGKQTSKVVVE